MQQSQQQQIQKELKELLAQSSHEQLMQVIDPSDQEKLRFLEEDDKRLQQLASQLSVGQIAAADRGEGASHEMPGGADKIFIGEQPVDSGDKRRQKQLADRERTSDGKVKHQSLSPPLVTSSKALQSADLADGEPHSLRADASGAAAA